MPATYSHTRNQITDCTNPISSKKLVYIIPMPDRSVAIRRGHRVGRIERHGFDHEEGNGELEARVSLSSFRRTASCEGRSVPTCVKTVFWDQPRLLLQRYFGGGLCSATSRVSGPCPQALLFLGYKET
jgi:hypothetical protein